jgi:hypothetical protein
MNLFRGRRSSTGGGDGGGAGNDNRTNSSIQNATASLRKVFLLPRSRTTGTNLGNGGCSASTNASVGNNGSPAATTSDSRSYADQQPPHRRTASLSRNLTRRSRSVTMPNIEAGSSTAGATSSNHQPQQFSTFRGQQQPQQHHQQHRPNEVGSGSKTTSMTDSVTRRRNTATASSSSSSLRPLSADVSTYKAYTSSMSRSWSSSATSTNLYGTMGHPRSRPQSRSTLSATTSAAEDSSRPRPPLPSRRGVARDRSVDSLVNHLTSQSQLQQPRLSTSATEGSLSFLMEEDLDEDEDDGATPVAGTPDVSQGRKAQLSSLDSLLDNGAASESMSSLEARITASSRAKSNSLPKTAFGSLQLKVAEIKAQLDTLKTDDRYTGLQRALGTVKTPTRPTATDGMQHPNTPSHGFEFMMPPNLTTSVSANYFPLFPSSTSSMNNGLGLGDHGGRTFHSPAGSSNSQCDTDSVSPMSSSPNRASPFTTTNTSTSSTTSFTKLPAFLPLLTMTGSSMSSSPSTLSPSSSNSLPSISRPQVLKLPQSHSLNTFPSNQNGGQQPTLASAASYTEEIDRLIFFFDVMSTQEKIAKVLKDS